MSILSNMYLLNSLKNNEKNNTYTTDGKVVTLGTEKDVNAKLAEIIGTKFTKYRELWDKANRMEIVTDFPLFLHLDMNQNVITSVLIVL